MSHDIDNVKGKVIPTNQTIKGFAGSRTANASKGTIAWK